MPVAHFAFHRWTKRHDHVVEACRALDVRDVLQALDPPQRTALRSWIVPTHPSLTLVRRDAGPFVRWWFLCPHCRRRCETLFIPPDVSGEDWRCRGCVCHGGLVYASQRHGRRHPLRQRLTPRKRVSRAKAVDRLRREEVRTRRRRDTVRTKQPTAQSGDHKPSAVRVSDERVIVIEVPRFGVEAPPLEQRVRVVTRAELEAERSQRVGPQEQMPALPAEDAETNAQFLREHQKSLDVRARAARALARMGKRIGL